MGQYYRPMLIDNEGTISTFSAHAYDNGLKLMEHSYIGNNFVNAVLSQIWKNPLRVAWIGDYSDSCDGDPYEKKIPRRQFMTYYKAAWGDRDEQLLVHPEPANVLSLRHKRRYLVNHSLKVYVDLGAFIAANKWHEKGYWYNNGHRERYSCDSCINPLPLLTACGNGRGGGDYYDTHPCYDMVGTWAFDLIELTDERPDDYEVLDVSFTEQAA